MMRVLRVALMKKYVYDDSDTDLYNFIVTFVCLKRLISKIVDGGTYLSIACNEAEDPSFLPAMGNLTNKKIALYASRDVITINMKIDRITSNSQKVLLDDYGTIFNVALISKWIDGSSLGWSFYESNAEGQVDTNKDIILNSAGRDAFTSIAGGSMSQKQKNLISRYYSKKYKTYYVSVWGESGYARWRENERKKIWGT